MMSRCGHVGRCPERLAGDWQIRRIEAMKMYALKNVQGVCEDCFRNTPSFGFGPMRVSAHIDAHKFAS